MAKNYNNKNKEKIERVRMSGNFQVIVKKLNENKNIVIVNKKFMYLSAFSHEWKNTMKDIFKRIMKANLVLLTNYQNNKLLNKNSI